MQAQHNIEREFKESRGVRDGKFLTFELDGEEYGVEILKVKEIIGIMNITPVPRTPEYVKGVINLRGKVIPVIDLRLKFSMENHEYDERTCIIVIDIADGAGKRIMMGIVVDSVSEVLNIRSEDVEETPAFGSRMDTGFILGMAKTKGDVKILLDIDKVMAAEEVTAIGAMSREEARQ